MNHHERGATKNCRKCDSIKPVEEFPKDRGRPDGRFPYCKLCNKRNATKWYYNNHERAKADRRSRSKAYYEDADNLAKKNEYTRRYRSENPGQAAQWDREWRAKNPDKAKQYIRNQAANRKANQIKRRLKLDKATPDWADRKAMQEFYKEAQRLSSETGVPHHVDHIYPIQGEVVSGLHCEFNLQVIPAIENIRKSNSLPMI